MAVAFVKEVRRDKENGWLRIDWECSHCFHVMSLPQQQDFNYCFHCGAKIILKLGGKEDA
jgi:DNA-directed RNA polymerase subunit RPC12/RpoP